MSQRWIVFWLRQKLHRCMLPTGWQSCLTSHQPTVPWKTAAPLQHCWSVQLSHLFFPSMAYIGREKYDDIWGSIPLCPLTHLCPRATEYCKNEKYWVFATLLVLSISPIRPHVILRAYSKIANYLSMSAYTYSLSTKRILCLYIFHLKHICLRILKLLVFFHSIIIVCAWFNTSILCKHVWNYLVFTC
jgi:hypothetical protein